MTPAVRWFNPGPRVYWRGRWFDQAFVTAVTDVEREQGYQEYFMQGSYNRGVSASAGTHNGGAVADKTSKGSANRKRHARRGIVFWPRTRSQGFSVHDHGTLMWASTASPGLKAQMYSWRNGRNGLASNGRDDSGVRGAYRHYLDWKRPARVTVGPDCYLKGVNISRRYGSQVRPYVSVRLIQTALNKINGGKNLQVDGVMGPLTLRAYNTFRRDEFGPDAGAGSIGVQSVKRLFSKAGMKVNVWDKGPRSGGVIL